ncbi:MAG: hypothetical protein QW204_01910, partial [Thermoplasmata archaeon]
MELLKNVIDFATAKKLLLENLKQVERVEVLGIADAGFRVLAEDIVSQVDVPPFNRAAMDGYAVIAEETAGAKAIEPITLRKIGEVHAGDMPVIHVMRG